MNRLYIIMLRPAQWLKNLMLFFPPFLSGSLFIPGVIEKGVIPFIAFCMVSSAGYIFNDLLDRERDRVHPGKCKRPIASGAVTVRTGRFILLALLFSALLTAFCHSPVLLLFLSVYAIVSFLYSTFLKSVPVADIFCVSAGFLVRLQAGGEVFDVIVSPWLFLTVFLLSIFLSTGKRFAEMQSLGDSAADHRRSLGAYPPGFLAGTMYMTAGAVLVTYAIYAINKQRLVYSVPLCLFGLLQYMFMVMSGKGGDPTESLLKDRMLFTVSIVWLLQVIWSIYF
ncbi:MAG TPA: decaprenyl-phosphate phosphoribosyltransferase [Deltaproteobacteria bacterium]|nr:decaprenyl-phosphate phosphoribosyltransferase [Deltaproteobacteria bacterium]HQB39843.1 decaprenyl-phosphate phosphoribosyltransferase [Deltaproteobacteria bacterium]